MSRVPYPVPLLRVPAGLNRAHSTREQVSSAAPGVWRARGRLRRGERGHVRVVGAGVQPGRAGQVADGDHQGAQQRRGARGGLPAVPAGERRLAGRQLLQARRGPDADQVRAGVQRGVLRGGAGLAEGPHWKSPPAGASGDAVYLSGNGEIVLPPTDLQLKGRSLRGLMGGHIAPGIFLPRLLALHERGRFPFDRLVRNYPFAQVNTAIKDSLAGAVIKPVLTFD
jgi:hypothetical protein